MTLAGPCVPRGTGARRTRSWIRRRSRIRGSVSPPTQRLTVFTDTPSWRAAASWVRPSRRSVDDIQSAKCRPGGLPQRRGSAGRQAALRGRARRRATGGRPCARLTGCRDAGQLRVRVQDVHLDVLGEDAERDLDRAGRPGRVEQGAEDGLADLPGALLGQRRLGQAAADEVADVGNPGGAGGEDLGQHHDRDDLDRASSSRPWLRSGTAVSLAQPGRSVSLRARPAPSPGSRQGMCH